MDNEKKLKQLKTARRLLLITLILFIAVFIVINTEYISLDNMGRIAYDVRTAFSGKNMGETICELSESREKEICSYKDGFVIASESVISVYSSSMYKYSDHPISLKSPVLCTNSKNILAFDRGGKTAYVMDSFTVIHTFTMEEVIINAGISENGSVFIITESYGYKSRLTVYNSSYAEVFSWDSTDEYILDAILDGDFIWAISIEQSDTYINTVLRKIKYTEATVSQKVTTYGGIYVGAALKKNGAVALMTDREILLVSSPDQQKQIYSYVTGSPVYYDQSDEYILLSYGDKVVFLDIAGNMLFSKDYPDVGGVYIFERRLFIFHDEVLTELSYSGEKVAEYNVPGSALRIVFAEGSFFAAGADFVEKTELN